VTQFFRLCAVALLLIGGGAFAQAAAPPARYIVKPGDTLLGLARDYMLKQADYLTVQKLNGVRDPRALPIGDVLLVPVAILKTEPIIGEIASFRGAVTVDGKPAALGMAVGQGAKVETGAGAFVTVRLPDRSAISLPSQSSIVVARLRRILLTGGIDRNFVLEAGRSRSTVTPFKDPSSSFRVTTPLSVTAVRGTDFRVALDPAGGQAMTEVVGGSVGVAASVEQPETLVSKAFGIIVGPNGIGAPIALLPPPQLQKVERTATGATITALPIEGAKAYRTQLATDINFQDVFDEIVSDTPSANFTLPPDARFFVRITAIAASGLEGMPATFAPGRPGAL
jgi:hypothetical protein